MKVSVSILLAAVLAILAAARAADIETVAVIAHSATQSPTQELLSDMFLGHSQGTKLLDQPNTTLVKAFFDPKPTSPNQGPSVEYSRPCATKRSLPLPFQRPFGWVPPRQPTSVICSSFMPTGPRTSSTPDRISYTAND